MFSSLPLVHYWAHVIARGRQYCVIDWLAPRQLEMLGISVVTPQCLTVGKAGLATNHTPLTAALVFPVELQQQQQKTARKPRTAHLHITQHQKMFWRTLPANKDSRVPTRELWAHGRGTYPPCNLRNGWETSAPANGKVWRGKCIVWALQWENRWGRAPVVGPTGHLNKQIAHLHLCLWTGDITSRRFMRHNTHCCIQHIESRTDAAERCHCMRITYSSVHALNRHKLDWLCNKMQWNWY